METFGQRFQRLRKEKNLTQEDVANKFNITPQSVSKRENDLSTPDIAIISDLASFLGVSLDTLLTGKIETVSIKKDIDLNKAILKIFVHSEDGDEVNINFPLGLGEHLLKAFASKSINKLDNDLKDQIDFNKIIEMVKNGAIGELINITSSDGDKVIIKVEHEI